MKISVGETRLFFDVEGAKFVPDGPQMRERPSVLALHGGPGFDHSFFKPILADLTNVAQVIYLDQRGHGRSDRSTPEYWNLDTWTEDVRRLCETLDIEHPIILGESFGGFVALSYATRYPDHPRALILESTAPVMDLTRIIAAFRRFGGDAAADAARRFFEAPSAENQQTYFERCLRLYSVRPMPEMREVMARMIVNPDLLLHFFAREMPHYDLRSQLDRIACPTLILSGKHDPICPIEVQQEMRAAINPTLVQFEEFDDASHNLLREQPDQVLTIMRRFLLDVVK